MGEMGKMGFAVIFVQVVVLVGLWAFGRYFGS